MGVEGTDRLHFQGVRISLPEQPDLAPLGGNKTTASGLGGATNPDKAGGSAEDPTSKGAQKPSESNKQTDKKSPPGNNQPSKATGQQRSLSQNEYHPSPKPTATVIPLDMRNASADSGKGLVNGGETKSVSWYRIPIAI
jgi:hypothetical protein